MIRKLLSLIVGYLILAISSVLLFKLSGIDPHAAVGPGYLIGSTLFGCVIAIVSGYVTAMIARRSELKYASVLAVGIGALAMASIFVSPGEHWSEFVTVFFISPSVLLGGFLRTKFRLPDHIESIVR